jgi:hypothetical protein
LAEHFRNISLKYETEKELTNYLYKNIFELCEKKFNPEDTRIDLDLEDDLYFAPEVLIGTKLKDGKFYIHHGKFNIQSGKLRNRSVSSNYLVYDYDVMGTGSGIAFKSLEQVNDISIKKLNKKISELPVEINVGIAMYVISQSKEYDLYSGGDTQIGIIDNDEFRKISVDEQPQYYYKMITYLSELLKEDECKIKEFLPVSITKLL